MSLAVADRGKSGLTLGSPVAGLDANPGAGPRVEPAIPA